jgi:hypothetical protein
MEAVVAWRILVATVPSAGMMGLCSPPSVRSDRCSSNNGVQEPDGEEPIREEPFLVGFWQGLTG